MFQNGLPDPAIGLVFVWFGLSLVLARRTYPRRDLTPRPAIAGAALRPRGLAPVLRTPRPL